METGSAMNSAMATAQSNGLSQGLIAPGEQLLVPDLWQQQAVRLLLAGKDVIVQAPTGAGKTLVFEQWLDQSGGKKVIFTVPTRALANDKFHCWRERGWRVGITTGDVVIDPDAPIVVATLETCRRSLMQGKGPQLLVIDEYQMLADTSRGVHYETALMCAPAETQLLLLSGSVGNPQQVADWLQRLGRTVALVECAQRPVPLEEVALEALPDRVPSHIQGRLPRLLARALMADLGPILVFAPRRRNAEALAYRLAQQFAATDFMQLTPQQRHLAGSSLARLLRHRVAYHHSGLNYAQRVGLIEPLARAGQLKIVVATTGLAAGINFSVRSVMVLDRDYRIAEQHAKVRPDELLQMFGRAGRRGIDERGTILFADRSARMGEARAISLKRGNGLDWSYLLTAMQLAVERGNDPIAAARDTATRLFAEEKVVLGFEAMLRNQTIADSPSYRTTAKLSDANNSPSLAALADQLEGGTVVELCNSQGIWERRPAPRRVNFGNCWYRNDEQWQAALTSPAAIRHFRVGVDCCLDKGPAQARRYGREVALAVFPETSGKATLRVTQWLRRGLRDLNLPTPKGRGIAREWSLEALEKRVLPLLPQLSGGGTCIGLVERNGTLYARLDFAGAPVLAFVDREGRALLNPRLRRREIGNAAAATTRAQSNQAHTNGTGASLAATWLALGLIDKAGKPTRRGIITSFFQPSEGLAIAACLEAGNYEAEELLNDLITLRAGHRFDHLDAGGCRISAICHQCFGHRDYPGVMRQGLPIDYGEGATVILQAGFSIDQLQRKHPDSEIRNGDIERARLEWQSLRHQIAAAPDYPWPSWQALRQAARQSLPKHRNAFSLDDLPALSRSQRKRHPTLHWV